MFELEDFMDIAFAPEGLGLAFLGSDDVGYAVVIRYHERGHFLLQELIRFQRIEEPVPLLVVLRLEIVVGDSEIHEELLGVHALPDHDMPEEPLMGHLVVRRES